MSYYKEIDGYTLVRKHFILLLSWIAKFVMILLLATFLYFLYVEVISSKINEEAYLKYVYFSFLFLVYNYAFIKLIVNLTDFYNNLLIVGNDQIIIISCGLIMKDDIEVIDCYRVMKMDNFSHGLLSNLLGYGDVVIEQQKNEVRTLEFIPRPYEVLKILHTQRSRVLDDRRKKYIIHDDNDMDEGETLY